MGFGHFVALMGVKKILEILSDRVANDDTVWGVKESFNNVRDFIEKRRLPISGVIVLFVAEMAVLAEPPPGQFKRGLGG